MATAVRPGAMTDLKQKLQQKSCFCWVFVV